MAQTLDRDDLDALTERIPPIVDLDAHVVEPPDVWSSRLPAKYRDIGPHIEYLPAGSRCSTGGGYIEEPGTEGPDVAWWFYEDHKYSVKRLIAAAGYPADEITIAGITFDEMRPGCWQPKAAPRRHGPERRRGAALLPELPAFLRADLPRRDRTRSSRCSACAPTTTGWSKSGAATAAGRLIPLCLVPLWDAQLAADEVRRNAARGVRAVAFSELPPYLGLPEHLQRVLGSVLRGVRRDGHGGLHAHRVGDQDAADLARRARCRRRHDHLRQQRRQPHRLHVLRRARTATRTCKLLFAECQIGWIPYLLERADDVWDTHRGWSESQLHSPEPPSTYYYRQINTLLLQGPGRCRAARARRRRQRHVRDRLPASGRHVAALAGRPRPSSSAISTDDSSHKLAARQRDPPARPRPHTLIARPWT